jgi:hypothetical protein
LASISEDIGVVLATFKEKPVSLLVTYDQKRRKRIW